MEKCKNKKTCLSVTTNEWKGIIKSYVLRFIMMLLFWVPLKRNRIMIYSHARKGFSCNPKYLTLALLEKYGSQLEIIWVSQYPESCKEIEDLGIPVIRANSIRHTEKYITTKVYVTNDSFPHWARHRQGQLWINLWHGAMNYKRIGYDCLPTMDPVERKLFYLKNRKPDLFIAGSRFFAEDTAGAFRLPEDIFLHSGVPRNDIFFRDTGSAGKNIRDTLGIPHGEKVVLYAPTFRIGEHSSSYGMDFMLLQQALHERFGGSWTTLFRNHSFVTEQETDLCGVVDVSGYSDMQELLLVADVLISDYSSCMWDFSLQKRPCFVYGTDFAEYQTVDRDFTYPVDKWPYPVAENMEQLADNIRGFDEKSYLLQLEKHHRDAGRLDTGTAAEEILEQIHTAAEWRKL